MVGLEGWHLDKSFHIVDEGNVYTGYFENDARRPLPGMDGAFWFSSYGQGAFPGAGRFFLANNTQNERPHSKPQVGGGESFTLDGGTDGGYFGKLAAVSSGGGSLTTAADVCWLHIGGHTPANCSTLVSSRWPGGKTGHALVILEGPGKGQWRRVVAVGGERSREITVDTPFDPPPVANQSVIQVSSSRPKA
jgi:hypothetical protein